MHRPGVPHHADYDKNAGHRLRYSCGSRHSGHIPMELYHKYQVQYYVDHSCYRKVIKGPSGIPHSPQYSAAEVVDQGECYSKEIDLQVLGGQLQHLLRCLHPDQNLPGTQNSYNSYSQAAVQRDEHSGVDCLFHVLFISCAVVSGCQYVRPYGKTQEKVEHQPYDSVVGAYGGQGVVPCKPAYYNYVSCVEQELQSGGAYERYGKQAYLLQKRAVAHIDLIIFRHIYIFLP